MTDAALRLTDSHCHLDFPDFDGEHAALIDRARAAGVGRMVTICTRLRQEPAVRALAEDVAAGRLAPEAITDAMISQRLDTHGLPDPDLVIRTSGETRTSNFLPWQSAYAEYDFTPTLWPDFSRTDLWEAVERYAVRDRRFGGAVDAPTGLAGAAPDDVK